MHPLNKFLTDPATGEYLFGFIPGFNKDFLEENDYWVYALQDIVYDSGGITAAAITHGQLFLNSKYLLFSVIHDETVVVIAEFDIKTLSLEEVSDRNILKIIQNRKYRLKVTDGEKTFEFMLLNHKGIVDKGLTQDFFHDFQQVKQGIQVKKEWHKQN